MGSLCSNTTAYFSLVLTVFLLLAAHTVTAGQCGLKHSVNCRTIGVKLCGDKCTEDGLALNFEYNYEALLCNPISDELEKIVKIGVHFVLPKTKSYCDTCRLNFSCSETRSGETLCVTAATSSGSTLNPATRSPSMSPSTTHHPTISQSTTNMPTTTAPTTPRLTTPTLATSPPSTPSTVPPPTSPSTAPPPTPPSTSPPPTTTPPTTPSPTPPSTTPPPTTTPPTTPSPTPPSTSPPPTTTPPTTPPPTPPSTSPLPTTTPPTTPPPTSPSTSPPPTTTPPSTPPPTPPSTSPPPTTTRPITPRLTIQPPTRPSTITTQSPTRQPTDKRCKARKPDAALRLASKNGKLAQVKRILTNCKVNINKPGKLGYTPALLAAKNNHRKVLKLLIKHGARVRKKDKNGFNILHWACHLGLKLMANFILPLAHVQIDSREKLGRTPAMLAALRHHLPVVELLVGKGASLTVTDNNGNTILHCACAGGDLPTVQYVAPLMKDINAKNSKKQTATKLALEMKYTPIFQHLLLKGGHTC